MERALNYLSNDPKLVNKIDSTMITSESSAKLNENLEALKHNFLFRGILQKIREKKKSKKSS
jgi:phospholipid/cholesterol/gamma-HCH transport system substrate-binding protein